MAVAVMLNNLFHDFAVALLAACLLVFLFIERQSPPLSAGDLARLYARLSRVTTGCWVVLALAGAVRTWAYRAYEWQPAAGRGQVVALAVKHVVLILLVVAGVAVQLRVRRRVKGAGP